MRYLNLLVLAFLFAAQTVLAQGSIILKTASFEDFPRPGTTPKDWYDCGMAGETPPDIQPNGAFQVTTKAQQGNTYLGLVTRANETWEGVSQKLSRNMESGKCYDFNLWLARAPNYVSLSNFSGKLENYNQPIKLIIYGGNSQCDKREKLAETGAIDHTTWKNYSFKLQPKGTYSYFFIEAYYVRTLVPYNGNILIDNLSPLEEVECSPLTVQVKKTPEPAKPKVADAPPVKAPIKKPKDTPKEVAVTDNTPVKNPAVDKVVEVKEAKRFDQIDASSVKKGDRFKMDALLFEYDSYKINESSYPQLQKLADFLLLNPTIRIEIGGHTNNLLDSEFAFQLSENRSNAVADFLRARKVNDKQLKIKGYGKVRPVATNETDIGRRLNQRVEVTIL